MRTDCLHQNTTRYTRVPDALSHRRWGRVNLFPPPHIGIASQVFHAGRYIDNMQVRVQHPTDSRTDTFENVHRQTVAPGPSGPVSKANKSGLAPGPSGPVSKANKSGPDTLLGVNGLEGAF